MRENLKVLSDEQLQEKLAKIENGITKEIESLRISYLYTENDPLAYLSRRIEESKKEIVKHEKAINTSGKKNQNLTQQSSQKDFRRTRSIFHQTELTKETAQLKSLQQLKKLLEDQNEITEEQALREATQAATPSAATPSLPEQSPSLTSKIFSFFQGLIEPRYIHGDAVKKIRQDIVTAPKTISHSTASRRDPAAEPAKQPTTSLQRTATLPNNSISSIHTASRQPFSQKESVVSQRTIKPEGNANATQDRSTEQNEINIKGFLKLLNRPQDTVTKREGHNKTTFTITGEITALSLEKSLGHYKKLEENAKQELIESLRSLNVEFRCGYVITAATTENNVGRLLIGIINQINNPIEAAPIPINVSDNQEPKSSGNTSQSTSPATTEITAGKDPEQPSGSNEIQQPQQPKPIAVSSGYAAKKPRSRKRADSAQPILSTSNKNEFLVDFSKIENALKNSRALPQEKIHKVGKISLHLHDSELNELERIALEEYKKDLLEEYKKDLKKTTFPFFSKKESEFEYTKPGDFLEFSKKNDRAFKYVLATQKLFEKRFKDPSYQHERAVAARANQQKKIALEINTVLEKNISSRQIHALAGLLKKERPEDYLTIVREIIKIQPEEKDYEKQLRLCGFLSAFGLGNSSSAREITNKTKNIILNQLNNSVDLESFGLAFQENLISGMLVSAEVFNKKHKELLENFEKAQRDAAMQKEQAEFTALENNSAMSILGISEITTRDALKKEERAEFILLENSLNETLSSASSVGAPSTLPSNVSALFQPSRDNAELCKVKKALSPVFESMMEICISENNEEITLIPAIFFCENPGFAYKHKESFDHCVACAKTLYTVLNNNSPSEQKTAELIRICSTQIDAKEILNFNSDFHKRLLQTKKNLTSLKSPTSSLQTFPSTSSLPTP